MKQKVKYALPVLMFFVRDISRLENDADTQYRFNRFWAWFWFIQMPLCGLLMLYFNHIWLLIFAIYVTEASLWANFATHFGAMSAALAARNTSNTITDINDSVDDIHEVIGKNDDIADAWQLDPNKLS